MQGRSQGIIFLKKNIRKINGINFFKIYLNFQIRPARPLSLPMIKCSPNIYSVHVFLFEVSDSNIQDGLV